MIDQGKSIRSFLRFVRALRGGQEAFLEIYLKSGEKLVLKMETIQFRPRLRLLREEGGD